MTLEGLILNFSAGWNIGVGLDFTVKATALRLPPIHKLDAVTTPDEIKNYPTIRE